MRILLSVLGIIGIASSSTLPSYLLADHSNNINYIKEAKKELTKDFSYNIDAYDYLNSKGFPKSGTYSLESKLKELYSSVKSFVDTNEIKEWKISEMTVKGSKPDGIKEVGKIEEYTLNNLNDAFHAQKIQSFSQSLIIKYKRNTDYVILKQQGSILADDKKYELPNLNGFPEDHKFNVSEYMYGLTVNITLSYTAVEQIDIKIGSYASETYVTLNYSDITLYKFKNQIIPAEAIKILGKLGYSEIKPEWLALKEISLKSGGKELNDELINGLYGAGDYEFMVSVEANELGKQNNIIGEMSFFMKVYFPFANLSTINNSHYELKEQFISTYQNILSESEKQIKNTLVNNTSAFHFLNGDTQTLSFSPLYDSKTNKRFNPSDFENLESATKKEIYTFITPTKYGTAMGIQKSAKVFITFTKH